MSARAFTRIVVLSIVGAAVAVPAAPVAAAPSCLGKPATHVMKAGDPPYAGTAGNDVVYGSSGPDTVLLAELPGIDLVCGRGGNDTLSVSGSGSIADGGSGDDQITADNVAIGRGGAGDDHLVTSYGSAEGGSGADRIDAYFWVLSVTGGSGDDTIVNFVGNPSIDCGSGRDTIAPNGATSVRGCEVVQTG